MKDGRFITIVSNKKEIVLDVSKILYVMMERNNAEIHVFDDEIYRIRMTLGELEKELGDDFIKVHRSCLVSTKAIHDITNKINLINGESLDYVVRRKKELKAILYSKQKKMISRLNDDNIPKNREEYHEYYHSFDDMPFAFADIEMVFNDERHAVDWIFRYGNSALATLENTPLEKLIDSSFGSLFSNMDPKWLRSYERATLYGEKLELVEYSPEIDKDLQVICFPSFKGHCCCILLDISELNFVQDNNDSLRALRIYFSKMFQG